MIRIMPKAEGEYTGVEKNFIPADFIPHRATAGSAGCDVRAAIRESIAIKPMSTALIPLGFALDMRDEPGLAAVLLPRSGLGHKQGIVLGNLVGLIDNDYQGEVMASVWNRNAPGAMLSSTVWITPGMVIAQIVFLRVESPDVYVMPAGWKVEPTDRGEGGFGSTGL